MEFMNQFNFHHEWKQVVELISQSDDNALGIKFCSYLPPLTNELFGTGTPNPFAIDDTVNNRTAPVIFMIFPVHQNMNKCTNLNSFVKQNNRSNQCSGQTVLNYVVQQVEDEKENNQKYGFYVDTISISYIPITVHYLCFYRFKPVIL